jgi:serine/threonine-protein kinase
LVVLLVAGTGCTAGRVFEVPEWTLLPPGSAAQVPLRLPTHINDHLPDERAYYTLKTTVAVPADLRNRDLEFAIPFLQATSQLRINGETVRMLDDVFASQYHYDDPHRFPVERALTNRGELQLELVVKSFSPRAGWLDTVPVLYDPVDGGGGIRFRTVFNRLQGQFGLWSTIMFAVLQLVLYLVSREAKHALLGFAALLGSQYPFYYLGYMQLVVGTADAYWMGVLVCLAGASNVAGTLIGDNKWKPHYVYAVLALVVILVLFYPSSNPFVAWRFATGGVGALLVGVGIGYLLGPILRRDWRSRSWGVDVNRGAWFVILLLALGDFGAFAGFADLTRGWRVAALALGVVSLTRAVVLSIDYVRANLAGEILNRELTSRLGQLEERNREIQVLNEELRHQVANNASELAERMSALSVRNPEIRQFQTGAVIGERYLVESQLGSGAMGSVYRARRLSDDRVYAVKVIRGDQDGVSRARLAREAQTAARVHHPNVVRLVDVDLTMDGTLFIVMELVMGPTVSQYKEKYRDLVWAGPIVQGVAQGLRAIHQQGIVHRDLKPNNVILSADGNDGRWVPKIMDFGLSFLDEESMPLRISSAKGSTALTQTGHFVGTPLYMPPEAFEGKQQVGTPGDVFAFGVMTRELLVGTPSPIGVPLGMAMSMDAVVPLPPMSDEAPGLDAAWCRLVEDCCQSDPQARPRATELVARVEAILAAMSSRRAS